LGDVRTDSKLRGQRAAAWLRVACTLLVMLATAGVVHAEPSVQVAGKLDGVVLGRRMALLEDPSGKLSLEDVQRQASRFAMQSDDAPSYGYSHSTYWIRLHVDNQGPRVRDWLLELAYPHLDDVTLYEPRQGGYRARRTGDLQPFESRDLRYRSFVFVLQEPAASARTYYLRVRSDSAITLTARAWDAASFLEYQPRDLGMLFLFYGVLVVMGCYNLCMWLFMRQREHLHYVGFIVSTGLLQFSISGHLFQYVLPHHGWIAQRMIALSMGLSLASSCFVGNAYLPTFDATPGVYRVLRRLGLAFLMLAPLTMVLSYSVQLRLMVACFGGLVCFSLLPAALLLRMGVARARQYIIAWSCVAVGFAVAGLRTFGVLPSNLFTEWSCQIGSSLQLVLLSSALADRINAMRADMGTLNDELSRKVELLENALLSAENATTRAEQATRVKDEFMATMSHELRTPLNAIINVPQGLLRDFARTQAVSCTRCSSTFELEQGEAITRETPCPDCAAVGALKPKALLSYTGKPEQTARYLQMIERSGKHLLQMVNGVLDFSKLELGRLELVLETIDLAELVREIGDEMMLYAERMGVHLELQLPKSESVVADPVRVKQVLLNLLSNAVKFSNGAGVVRVGLSATQDAVELYVKDEGIGIAPEHFDRIFASFEQVHKGNTRQYGGAGLGLSISRSLARMHGGELWVESELGQGATFYFRIPRGLTGGRSRTGSNSRLKSVTGKSLRHSEGMAS
jgi:signal transduction histidine kinase